MDKYEATYNFRFEDKQGAYLTTHTRDAPEDSMRRVDDKRKQNRLDAKTRKDEEKQRRKGEIDQLKALKREEIVQKLKRTQFLAGDVDDKKFLDKAEKELQSEFIPDLYDKAMDNIFNEKYYQIKEENGEDLENQLDINMNLLNDRTDRIGMDKENNGEEDSQDQVSDID